jgi:hypothetical protein
MRKTGLVLYTGGNALDLSQFHIKFDTQAADVESPNSAAIRVYNMKAETLSKIVTNGEYNNVVLNAGYQQGNYGVIFQGAVKQYRVGRENQTDTFLDILASDGDVGYNQGFVNQTLDKSATDAQRAQALIAKMPKVSAGNLAILSKDGNTTNIRGKVQFGMARALMRDIASTYNSSWSIQNGQVNVLPFSGYLPGEAVKINRYTGLIGLPEQTDEGIKLSCLLNPKLRVGGLVQLDNSEVNQIKWQKGNTVGIPYNQWAGFQYNTPLSQDGMYRAFVIEHSGDTRGRNWYSRLVCLAVDLSTQTVAGNNF